MGSCMYSCGVCRYSPALTASVARLQSVSKCVDVCVRGGGCEWEEGMYV